jgi:hypothetical protein
VNEGVDFLLIGDEGVGGEALGEHAVEAHGQARQMGAFPGEGIDQHGGH